MYKNEIRRIWYSSKVTASGPTTGLADVTVTLYNPSGHVVLNGVAMTELGSGWYYHDYRPAKEGVYVGSADSASVPLRRNIEFEVTDKPSGGSVTKIYKEAFEKGEKEAIIADIADAKRRMGELMEMIGKDRSDYPDKVGELFNQASSQMVEMENRMFSLSQKQMDESRSKQDSLEFTLSELNRRLTKLEGLSGKIDIVSSDIKNALGRDITDNSKRVDTLYLTLKAEADNGRNMLERNIENLNEALVTEAGINSQSKRDNDESLRRVYENIDRMSKMMLSIIPTGKLMKLKEDVNDIVSSIDINAGTGKGK